MPADIDGLMCEHPGKPEGQSRTFEAGEATCASNEPDEQKPVRYDVLYEIAATFGLDYNAVCKCARAAVSAPVAAQPAVSGVDALIDEFEYAVLAKSQGLDPFHKRLPAAREALRTHMPFVSGVDALLQQALDAMEGFRALVKGECPSLLDHDGGADAERFDSAMLALRTHLSTALTGAAKEETNG